MPSPDYCVGRGIMIKHVDLRVEDMMSEYKIN